MNISVVIQGPTAYYKDILSNVRNIDNIEFIWSTWEDEPKENLENIYNSGIKIVLNKKPVNSGYGNINLQTVTTIGGIVESSNEYVLKIRSDMIISDYYSFLKLLYNQKEKINFLCWHNVEKMYPVDYISFGLKDEMIEFWNLYSERYDTFAERQLIENFCSKKNIDINSYLLNKFNYFLDKINTQNIKIFWIKNNTFINDYIIHEEFKY